LGSKKEQLNQIDLALNDEEICPHICRINSRTLVRKPRLRLVPSELTPAGESEKLSIKKQRDKLKELRRLNAEEILIMDEWIRLSIVERIALIGAYKNIYPGAKGDLEGALMLFREIKQNQMWHERNIENNYRPIEEQLNLELRALKLGVTSAELVARQVAQEKKHRASRAARQW
jgi:hypothetical protein